MNAAQASQLKRGQFVKDQQNQTAMVLAEAEPNYVLLNWENEGPNVRHVWFFEKPKPAKDSKRTTEAWDGKIISVSEAGVAKLSAS